MLDASNWQKGPPFDCETVEDSELLNQMAEQAERYVSSFRWAPDIEQLFFAGGVPGGERRDLPLSPASGP